MESSFFSYFFLSLFLSFAILTVQLVLRDFAKRIITGHHTHLPGHRISPRVRQLHRRLTERKHLIEAKRGNLKFKLNPFYIIISRHDWKRLMSRELLILGTTELTRMEDLDSEVTVEHSLSHFVDRDACLAYLATIVDADDGGTARIAQEALCLLVRSPAIPSPAASFSFSSSSPRARASFSRTHSTARQVPGAAADP